MRFHDKKKKKKRLKLKKKNEPNPVKEALKAIQEYLQEKQNPNFAVGSRIASNLGGRASPLLFHKGSFTTNTANKSSSVRTTSTLSTRSHDSTNVSLSSTDTFQ